MGASGPLKPSDGKLRATDSVMDATGEIAVAADTGDQLGESPVWDRAGNCLWWIDLRRPALHRLEGGTVATMDLPALVGAVVPGGDGRTAWVALPDGWWIVRGTGMRRAFAFPDHGPGYRLNDAKCGADGTLWFGSMRDRGADEAFEQQQPFLRSMRLGRRQCDPFSHGEPRAFLRACLVETDLALRSGQQDMEATLEVAVQIENRVVARLP